MKAIFSKVLAGAVLTSAIALGSSNVAFATTANTNACVDGNDRSNLSIEWNATDKVSIKTVNDKPLCADTILYFSSYVMPKNYDGTGFGGPTSYPQTLHDTNMTVLRAGTNGQSVVTVNIPKACENMQVDVYYGPEIKTVTAAGHGAQYITGKVLQKTADTCETPVITPEVPKEEAQTPETPAPVVTVAPAPEAPAALPNAGANAGTIAFLAAGATIAGTAVAEFMRRRS